MIRVVFLLVVLLCGGCRPGGAMPGDRTTASAGLPEEADKCGSVVPVHEVSLPPPWGRSEVEFSAGAQSGREVVLLPQYPREGALVVTAEVSEEAMEEAGFRLISVEDGGLPGLIEGYDGFEALAIEGDEFFAAIEAREVTGTMAWLVRGQVMRDEGHRIMGLRVDGNLRTRLVPSRVAPNRSFEALLLREGEVLALPEMSQDGEAIVLSRVDLRVLRRIRAPDLPWRVTDATPLGADGTFTVVNYLWRGDRDLAREHDPFAPSGCKRPEGTRGGRERLVHLRLRGDRFETLPVSPLRLAPGGEGDRNWEGIARLDRGYLVVTDRYPRTILARISDQPPAVRPD